MKKLGEEEKVKSLLVWMGCGCEVQQEVSCMIINRINRHSVMKTLLVQIEYLSETLWKTQCNILHSKL